MHGTFGAAGDAARTDIRTISGRPLPPTFECEVTRFGNFRFKCPWCKSWHMHGGGGGLGHRASHCERKDSPWKWSGYFLTLKKS